MNDNKNKSYYEKIGKRIKRCREVKELTQAELASRLSTPLTATAISLYEKGEREASLEVLAEIAEILNVSLQFLILDEENTQTPSIKVALRADKQLNEKARTQIMDYIEFIKNKSLQDGDRGKKSR
jgi:transcriptional regulator with XRE-family HTH domain